MSSRATPQLKYLVSQCGEDKAACVNSKVDCCTPSKTQSAIAFPCARATPCPWGRFYSSLHCLALFSHPALSVLTWTYQLEHRMSPVSPKAAGVCADTWQHAGL